MGKSDRAYLLALVTLGLGTVIGANLANMIYVANTVDANTHDWRVIWLIPAVTALIVAAIFAAAFYDKKKTDGPITPAEGLTS